MNDEITELSDRSKCDEVSRRDLLIKGVAIATGVGIGLSTTKSAVADGTNVVGGNATPPLTPTAPTPPITVPPTPAPLSSPNLSRTASEAQIINDIKDFLENGYGLQTNTGGGPSGGGIGVGNPHPSGMTPMMLRIENGIEFDPPTIVAAAASYNPLQIEPLLDQAADLIERGLRDRAEWDDKAVKALNVALELGEYQELDSIHEDEEAKGVYQVEAQVALAETAAMIATRSYFNFLVLDNTRLLNTFFSPSEKDKLYNLARRQAWFSSQPAMYTPGQGLDWRNLTWDGVNQPAPKHAVLVAEQLFEHEFPLQLSLLAQRSQEYASQVAAAERRLTGLSARSDWERENVRFRVARTKVARKYQDLKARAATSADGVLNYPKRMKALKERFEHDFREAKTRLTAIQPGLAAVYGYDESLPINADSIQHFDDCLLWVREAINWMVRFSRAEQNYVLPMSVRQLSGTDWNGGLNNGQWNVVVPEAMFPDQRYVRLRGLSAFVVEAGTGRDLWQVTVRPPARGIFRHLSNVVRDIDQSMIPPCRMGRVSTRDSIREPDISGLSTLHNASPIGALVGGQSSTWTVEVAPRSLNGADRSQLQDIHLDLHLAVRSAD